MVSVLHFVERYILLITIPLPDADIAYIALTFASLGSVNGWLRFRTVAASSSGDFLLDDLNEEVRYRKWTQQR